MTDMMQHQRTLANGTRIAAGGDAIHVAPSGVASGYVTIVVESVDGGVTLSKGETERLVAAIKAAMGGA
jgi:hypothetical protein